MYILQAPVVSLVTMTHIECFLMLPGTTAGGEHWMEIVVGSTYLGDSLGGHLFAVVGSEQLGRNLGFPESLRRAGNENVG